MLIRSNPKITEHEISNAFSGLRRFSNFFEMKSGTNDIDAGLSAGLLKYENGIIEWSHYTIWEYFFSSLLHDQITTYSSKILARIDLVNGYNINRLLIPMINRSLLCNTLSDSGIICTISPNKYQGFRRNTGWRRTKYGIHPSVSISRDNVASASFKYDPQSEGVTHNDLRHGEGITNVACQISWYDAAAYAHWAKVILPKSNDLRQAKIDRDFIYWCSDWHSEKLSHICAYDARSNEVVGLNPDVRLSRTALAVIIPDQT